MTDAEAEQEIRASIDRMTEALRAGDRDTLAQLLTDESIHVGTDPDEWWTKKDLLAAPDDVMGVEGEQITAEMGDLQIHVHGDVAWVEGTGAFVNADGARRPIRMTSVHVREDDQWRSAQSHASIGVPNPEMFSG